MTPLTGAQRLSAGALALLLHAVFFAALMFSVSWRHTPQAPVFAELWTQLPAPQPAPPANEAVPPPERPAPVVEPKPLPKPDIALKARDAEKRRLEDKRREEAEQRKRMALKKAALEKERKEEEEAARKKAEAEKKAREARQRALDAALARQAQDEIAQEGAQIRQQAQAASLQGKLIDDYRTKIIQKVRGYLRLPPSLVGNPEAVFRVDLLPNGEVQGTPMLLKSSGQPLYDREVERAIIKASPLPLPPDRGAAAAFRNGLTLKFRPHEQP